MKLASFDIFDTILIRKCGLPENIFYLTARKLFGNDNTKVDYFYFWRKQAEAKAVCNTPNKSILLENIYQTFEYDYFGVDQASAMSAEKAIESENLTINPQVSEIIKKYRSNGFYICFISDMYLDSKFLREVLEREGCIKDEEKLFVSCEHNATKAQGNLYDIIKKEMTPSKWLHYGDNKQSDIKQAKIKGIKANYVETSFTQTESKVLEHFRLDSNYIQISIIVGWMRCVRISMCNTAAAEIAANFIAPLYISYVQYIIEVAHKKGIKQLYFLNRDSYLLFKLAFKFKDEKIDLRYHFISRRSLVLPSLERLRDDDFLEVFDKSTLIRKNVDGVLAYIKSSRSEFKDLGIEFAFNKITTSSQQQEVLDKIFRSKFTPILRQRIVEEKNLLCNYFKQEGVTNSENSAFVDVGWLGTSRLMVNRVLKSIDHKSVDFFYLGVRADVLPMKYGHFYSYIKEPVVGLTTLIENYFSISPYKSVLSYQVNADEIVPIFKEEEDKPSAGIIIEQNLAASTQLTQLIQKYSQVIDIQPTLANISNYVIDIFLNQKTKISLDSFLQVGSFDSPLQKKDMPFVKKMSFVEMFKYSVLGVMITAFDPISVNLTVGRKIGNRLVFINRKVGRVKSAILKRIGKL